MHSVHLHQSLPALFSELVYGAPASGAFILNPGDRGLLASMDRLTSQAASTSRDSGGTIAAHIRHVTYGFSLMNRWAAGENPFEDANWSQSWEQQSVTAEEWLELRRQLREEVDAWHGALQSDRALDAVELRGAIGSIAHLAYHIGAIRQIDPSARGPRATD